MHARRRVKSSRLNENAEKRNDYAVVRKRFMYAKCGTLTRVRSEYYEVGCPVLADSFHIENGVIETVFQAGM